MKIMKLLRHLTLEQGADYLMASDIHQTVDMGFEVINIGTSEAGIDYVLVNDANGETLLIEQILVPL
jgi:hypothetical protein